MNLVHPDVSLAPLLDRIVLNDVHYFVCLNNVLFDLATVLADLNAPIAPIGPTAVVAAAWTLRSLVDHKQTFIAPPISLTYVGAGDTAYGYYLTNTANTLLLAIAAFDVPIALINLDQVPIIPILGDLSRFAV